MTAPALKRNLSLTLLTLYGLGTTIGAGIYVLVGKVAGEAGTLAPLSFVVASVLAGLTALSFSELVGRYPRSAGEAVYVEQAFGVKTLSLAVGLAVVLIGLVSAAAIVNGVVGYLQNIVALPNIFAVLLIGVSLAAVAAWGIKESVFAAGIVTALEIAGLLVIVWAGRGTLVAGPMVDVLSSAPGWSAAQWMGVGTGAVLAFYAFIGFEDMVNVAEEVRDPGRTFPKAIILTLVITMVLYFLVSWISVRTLSVDALSVSVAPLSDVFSRLTGWPTFTVDAVASVAVLNGALIQVIMGSRVLYGLANQGWLPAIFARVEERTRTPVVATLAASSIMIVLAISVPLVTLATVTSLLTLIVFAFVNVALLRLKFRDDGPPAGHTVPAVVPLAGFVCCTAFAAFQVTAFFR